MPFIRVFFVPFIFDFTHSWISSLWWYFECSPIILLRFYRRMDGEVCVVYPNGSICMHCMCSSIIYKKYQITACGISHWAWIAALNAKMKWRKTKTHFCHYTSFTNHHCHWKQGSSGEFTVNISFNNSCIRKKRSDIPFLITNHPKLSSHFVTQKWPVNKLKCEIHLRTVQKCS